MGYVVEAETMGRQVGYRVMPMGHSVLIVIYDVCIEPFAKFCITNPRGTIRIQQLYIYSLIFQTNGRMSCQSSPKAMPNNAIISSILHQRIYFVFLQILFYCLNDRLFNFLISMIETTMNLASICTKGKFCFDEVKVFNPIFPSPWVSSSENKDQVINSVHKDSGTLDIPRMPKTSPVELKNGETSVSLMVDQLHGLHDQFLTVLSLQQVATLRQNRFLASSGSNTQFENDTSTQTNINFSINLLSNNLHKRIINRITKIYLNPVNMAMQ